MSVRNIEAFFAPKSIALIGASQRELSVGAVIAKNLLSAGFDGPIMPVNPHEPAIQSVVAYQDIAALPVAPDLAVVATPAETVPDIIRALGARGCRAAVVVSAGFETATAGGTRFDEQLRQAGKESGIRVIGPNCLGVMAPHSHINASFAHIAPAGGRIACVMQSGAVVASVLEWANSRNIGFSKVISLGDAIDVDFGDMLNFLATDPETDAVFLYIEGLTHARKFMAAARALSRIKPVIAMKAGRNPAAAKAVRSHTGALAGSDRVYEAALRRAGIVRVDSLEQMFDAAEILGRPRTTCGNRVAIITNGGGAGILATDAMQGDLLRLAELSAATIATLDRSLPASWSRGNPVDVIGDADGARYAQSLGAAAADPNVDALLVVNCPTAITSSAAAAIAVVRARRELQATAATKPVVACWMGSTPESPAWAILSKAGIPIFDTPERAVGALKLLRRLGSGENAGQGGHSQPRLTAEDRHSADRLLQGALRMGREWLDEAQSKALLTAYGIPVAKTVRAATPADVAQAARTFCAPVAVKILSPDIQHKSDVGGVALALETPEAAHDAAAAMLERVAALQPHARLDGFTVSPMIVRRDGRELIAGIATDPTFGPIVLFGHGGIAAEQIDDVAVALPPLTMETAETLIQGTRVARLLKAFRDWPQANLPAVQSVLVSLGHMALEHPEIVELDINPLIADGTGVIALDARVRIKDPAASVPAALQCHLDGEHAVQDRQGHQIYIRPIHPDDAPALNHFIETLDPMAIRARFFETIRRLPPAMLAHLTQVETDREMAFVAAERPRNGDAAAFEDRIRGVGRIVLLPDGKSAEYALTADKTAIDRGIAKLLMTELIAFARKRGVERLCGEELNDSHELIALARDMGADVLHDAEDPTIACIALSLLPVAATV